MKELLNKLNITVSNIGLYELALTHASFAYENKVDNNEKLEFLGDAVIELLMSDYLYKEGLQNEGMMTKKRAQAVCEEALVKYAEKIELANYLKIGKGEKLKGANNSMIADAFEAVIGAIYLDLGFDAVCGIFNTIVVPHLHLVWGIKDYKSTLQEYIQSGGKRNISYVIIKEKGPSHDRLFESAVKLDNYIVLGIGRGKTKKESEQNAAKNALEKGNYDNKKVI